MKNNQVHQYEVESSHRFQLSLIPKIAAMTQGLFGKGYGFAMRRLKPLYKDKLAYAKFSDNSRFFFRLGDDYWNRMALPDYEYEPELAGLLSLLKEQNFVFFDAGANLGYWSVLMSSEPFGKQRVIAIEASKETFELLQLNCEKNDNRFEIHHRAIFSKDGEVVSFSTGAHAARHISSPDSGDSESVTSVTLDSLARTSGIDENARIVIKLDVEGAEIPAMNGARELLDRDCLLIFEDHGKDTTHETTKYVMENLKMPIFYVHPGKDKIEITEVTTLSLLDDIKIVPGIGYNFFAARTGSLFHDLMSDLAKSSA